MKKLILFLLLFFTISATFAQEDTPQQFRRIYTEVVVTQKGEVSRREAENTVLFNYGNQPEIKMYMSDGSVRYYEQISSREEGSTEGGMRFNSATYQEKTSNFTFYVQLFYDKKYGCRFIFSNGDMIQFIE